MLLSLIGRDSTNRQHRHRYGQRRLRARPSIPSDWRKSSGLLARRIDRAHHDVIDAGFRRPLTASATRVHGAADQEAAGRDRANAVGRDRICTQVHTVRPGRQGDVDPIVDDDLAPVCRVDGSDHVRGQIQQAPVVQVAFPDVNEVHASRCGVPDQAHQRRRQWAATAGGDR